MRRMDPKEMEILAEVRLEQEDGIHAETGTAWRHLAAFAEQVSESPPESSRVRETAPCPLRADREEKNPPPIRLPDIAPERQSGLLLVPRVL